MQEKFRSMSVKFVLLLGYIGVSIWRFPGFFSRPRFWAEEAGRFFCCAYSYAGCERWYRALFYVNPQRGYYALWETFATVLAANLVALEHAPLATTLLALVAQMVPVALIVWGRRYDTVYYKALAICVVLFAIPSNEVWLNTINSKFHLTLAVFIILVDRNGPRKTNMSRLQRWTKRGILLVGGLTGPVACSLGPLFGLQYLFERCESRHEDSERLVQMGILLTCGLFQLYGMNHWAEKAAVSGGGDCVMLPMTWLSRTLLSLGLGSARAGAVWSVLNELFVASDGGLLAGSLVAIGIALVLGLCVTVMLGWRRASLYVGAYGILMVSAMVGGVAGHDWACPGNHMRYFFAPNVVFSLMLLEGYVEGHLSLVGRLFLGACITLILCNGVLEFRSSVIYSPAWADWGEEVAAWRAAGSPAKATLRVWPGNWFISLFKNACP